MNQESTSRSAANPGALPMTDSSLWHDQCPRHNPIGIDHHTLGLLAHTAQVRWLDPPGTHPRPTFETEVGQEP